MGQPTEAAFINAPDSEEGWRHVVAIGADSRWRNRVSARWLLSWPYSPARHAADLHCAWLVCVGEADQVARPGPAIAAARLAPHGELRTYRGVDHFDIYDGPEHEAVVADEIDFLRRHLLDAAEHDAEQRDDPLDAVRQVDRDPVSGADPGGPQTAGDRMAVLPELRVAQPRAPDFHDRLCVGVAADDLLERGDQRPRQRVVARHLTAGPPHGTGVEGPIASAPEARDPCRRHQRTRISEHRHRIAAVLHTLAANSPIRARALADSGRKSNTWKM